MVTSKFLLIEKKVKFDPCDWSTVLSFCTELSHQSDLKHKQTNNNDVDFSKLKAFADDKGFAYSVS